MARQKSSGTLRHLLGAKLGGTSGSGRSWSSKLRAMSSGKLREMYKVMGGASGKQATPPADDDVVTTGLRQLLKGSGKTLEGKLAEMVAWCRDEDIETIEMLRDMEDELIEALNLKAGPAKHLRKRIREYGEEEASPGKGKTVSDHI